MSLNKSNFWFWSRKDRNPGAKTTWTFSENLIDPGVRSSRYQIFNVDKYTFYRRTSALTPIWDFEYDVFSADRSAVFHHICLESLYILPSFRKKVQIYKFDNLLKETNCYLWTVEISNSENIHKEIKQVTKIPIRLSGNAF